MVSGTAWLVFFAGEIGGLPIADAVSQGLAWIVLTRTAFGGTWVLRLEMAGAIFNETHLVSGR